MRRSPLRLAAPVTSLPASCEPRFAADELGNAPDRWNFETAANSFLGREMTTRNGFHGHGDVSTSYKVLSYATATWILEKSDSSFIPTLSLSECACLLDQQQQQYNTIQYNTIMQ
ncbi:hypothetical protein THAOC_01192 [Thalassiosira oceanica]|uniref:Uncharacterized protein n=1 Tax=Thalassiosira oceanica TaxID=159749 RepID=K0TR15_THAOC|nr:hypothetical protein THAOC_01192 [Thalassiosira oceanica]|eukprot:EJK77007.1 hypothetical protein THAOC_01192 [Thalassiosira oceanica]